MMCRWIAVALAALVLASSADARRQRPDDRPADGTVAAAGQVPDVQVAVAPGKAGWSIALVYPRKTSDASMKEDAQRVGAAIGTRINSVRIEHRRLERLDTKGVGEAPVMSSATFQTDANLVDYSGGRVAAEVLITALQRFNRIAVIFFVPGKFVWKGARSYQDDKLAVDVTGGEGAYAFVANIRSRPINAFTLESRADPPVVVTRTESRGGAVRTPWLVVLGAMVTAVAAFVVAKSVARR